LFTLLSVLPTILVKKLLVFIGVLTIMGKVGPVAPVFPINPIGPCEPCEPCAPLDCKFTQQRFDPK
jgi:hypothetical protein